MKLLTKSLAGFLLFVIFVQGASFASAQGPVQAWVQRYAFVASTNGSTAGCIGLDTNGNVFVSGSSWNGSNYGFATVAYSNNGTPLWTNRYDAGIFTGSPSALAAGRDGTIFVTGSTYIRPPDYPEHLSYNYSFVTIAYSNNGVALWTNSFSEGGDAQAGKIVVGQSGTVFVTGNAASTTTFTRMTTVAYSSAGMPLWTNHFGDANPTAPSYGTGIAIDNNEHVFVGGTKYWNDGSSHYALVAYSAAGVPLWTNQYVGAPHLGEFAAGVAVDGSGNVYLTGESHGPYSGYEYIPDDYVTVAYSGGGIPLLTNIYGTGTGGISSPSAITVDTNGNVFVTGISDGDRGYSGFATTVAYSAAGLPLWTNSYDSSVRDGGTAVTTDGHGHVVVLTASSPGGYDADCFTIWYSTNGTALWTNRFKVWGNGRDIANNLAADAVGNVFVTGSSWNGTNYEFVTIKYTILDPIPLQAQRIGEQIVLSWTNAAFGLQAAPRISDVFTNVPGATSPYTNGIAGGSQFFRLISM